MGAGGRISEKERGEEGLRRGNLNPLLRIPVEKPPFTLSQIKNAVPPHCFRRSALRSFSYVARDALIAGALFYLAFNVLPTLSSPFHFLAWPLYWVAQGSVLMGVWVIAHECGHHAFSEFSLLDDAVGLVLHSLLLVPYFSWKYSHRRHHSNVGSLDRDEAFVPKPRSSVAWFSPYLNNPFGRVLSLTVILTIGWPMYLLFNASGRRYHRFACHFDPYSPIFNDRERTQIIISDAGLLAAFCLIYRFATSFSLAWVFRVYGAPLLVTNAWLVLITYLQHTHPSLPRYNSAEWDWLRGALTTIDRDYGLLNHVFHNLTDTHVAHHLLATIPHYHAMEATKAIRPILGKYYCSDNTPVAKALWREATACIYVEPDKGKGKNKGVFWYRSEL